MKEPFTKQDIEFLRRHRNILWFTFKHLTGRFPNDNQTLLELGEELQKLFQEFIKVRAAIDKKIKRYDNLDLSFVFDSEIGAIIKTALKNQDTLSEKIYSFVQNNNFAFQLRTLYKSSNSHSMARERSNEYSNNMII